MVKNPPVNAGDVRDAGLIPWPGRSPGGGNGNLLQYSCWGESHGQRNLAGYSPWGCKDSVVTEWLSTIKGGKSPEGCDGHGPGKFLCEMTSELLPDCQEGVIQWKFRRPHRCGKKE